MDEIEVLQIKKDELQRNHNERKVELMISIYQLSHPIISSIGREYNRQLDNIRKKVFEKIPKNFNGKKYKMTDKHVYNKMY